MFDYEGAVRYLEAHIAQGVKPGLDRIRRLLMLMGNPESGFPIIHVAGTNGKTSTSRIATQILAAHGLSSGTFTSPHLEEIQERLAINGEYATPEDFAQAVSDVSAFADLLEKESGEGPTYFEITAASALAWFADRAVDAAVLEVGLGGRLDATNAVSSDVAVVTSVGMDHMDLLGDTLEAIAGEKLAIAEPGRPLVTGPLPDEALSVARSMAGDLELDHLRFGKDFVIQEAIPAVGGWQCDVAGVHGDYEELYLPLHGRHQTNNLSVAIAAVETLLGRELDHDALREGIGQVLVDGRMEVVAGDQLIMLDGAHNPDGFRALGEALAEEYPTHQWHIVLGSRGNKPLDKMAASLAPVAASFIATEIDDERCTPSRVVADRVRSAVSQEVADGGDLPAAIDLARSRAEGDGSILITGSLYVVGEARALMAGHDRPRPAER